MTKKPKENNDVRLKREINEWYKLADNSLAEYRETHLIDSEVALKVINKAQILLIRANDQL